VLNYSKRDMEISIFKDTLFFGLAIGYAGKILLGITVINVHSHIIQEKQIDGDVLKYMRKERVLGITGIVLMTIGFLLEMSYYGYLF